MTAYLLVRASVEKDSREGFDQWYEKEHLPSALQEFEECQSAWRGWSDVEEGVHLAFYEFPTLEAANSLLASNLMREFIKEFDSHWLGKVNRSREVFSVKQYLKKN